MAVIEAKISVTQLPEIGELFEVLVENVDQLPKAVVDALTFISDGDALIWDTGWLDDNGYDSSTVKVFADGKQIDRAASLHPIRKVIAAYDDNNQPYEIKAEHAQLVLGNGSILREW